MTRILSRILIVSIIITTFGSVLLVAEPKAKAGYNPNTLCTDSAFINTSTLSASGIQNFLNVKGSFLRSFSQNGKSAAQIIYNASRAYGINPIAILATIQKEEGIVYGTYAASYNQTRVDWAMGYGYTDSKIYSQYRGFSNQIDNGTWQLRRNYDYWATNGSEWNVGRTMSIDGRAVTFTNRCTSSLYRYTPHLGGNYNFNYYFNAWGGENYYDGRYSAQGPYSGPGAYGKNIMPNQEFTIWVNYKNTSNTYWYRNQTAKHPTPVRLGSANPHDRGSVFLGGHNQRGLLVQSRVAPGQIGTFKITLRAPLQQGTYVESFQPLAEYITWFGPVVSWTFNVSVADVVDGYRAQLVAQGPYTGPGSYNGTLARGQTATLWVSYRNVGRMIWYRGGSFPTRLGTDDPKDRGSIFLGNRNIRGTLVQDKVYPGGIGTFKVTIIAPSTPGTYYEKFSPLTEYITWMSPGVYWKLTVR